ncbi:MAG: ABC transporter permease subunit, partial [Phyllobacterium sp.]
MIRAFGWNEFLFIVFAVQWTIALSAIAFVGGGIGGLAIALVRVSNLRIPRLISIGFIRIFQGTPLLMQLFLVFFGMNIFGLPINPWIAAAIALTLHASAFLGEIWRGCIEAVPGGQSEAATALGLRYLNRMRYI